MSAIVDLTNFLFLFGPGWTEFSIGLVIAVALIVSTDDYIFY